MGTVANFHNRDMMVNGKLMVVTGPSGVGKGTLVRALLDRNPDIFLSISATTRSPRPGEVDGQHYYFLSREQFESWIAGGELLEWAEYAGNYYGTPRQAISDRIHQGQTVLLEIELLGARQVKASFPDAQTIMILPPSLTELETRLRGRGDENEASMAKRLARAQEEIAAKDEFDHCLVNDDLETAVAQLLEIFSQGHFSGG